MAAIVDLPLLAFLGIQFRYWAIIILVIIVILAVLFYVRGRSA